MSASAAIDLLADGEPDHRPVLASAPLRPGFARADLSRYGDATWDLAPAVFRENARRSHMTVRFDGIANPAIAEHLRQFLYARLNIDLPGHRAKLMPAGVRNEFCRARRFLEYLARTQNGVVDLRRADQPLFDAYARGLKADGKRQPKVTADLLDIIKDFYAYAVHLPSGGLAFEPWPRRSSAMVAGHRYVAGENRTPRIPEAVIAPLLAWSLRYISVFAPDILAARAELTGLEQHREALRAEDALVDVPTRQQRRRERLTAFFARRAADQRGVPIWTTAHNGTLRRDAKTGSVTPPINAHLLHLHVGVDAIADPASHLLLANGASDLIEDAVTKHGLEVGGMDTPIGIDTTTGQPWRNRFDVKTLQHEERMLQAAAYIVCAYLTGMRDCELQAMRPGCLSLTRSDDGVIVRHRVRSTAYKAKASHGEPAEWVTIAPVAEAIAVLEQLSARAAIAHGVETLWPVLVIRPDAKTYISGEIVRQLNVFRDHLNAQFGTSDAPAVPAGPNGVAWRLTTRQFRRTIAWHIANRPFGTVAGMIQYKHASIAAFEGYAGSSPSGFRAEIETQRQIGQIDDVLTYFDERQTGVVPSGPAGPRIARTLDAAVDELEPLPGMIADRGRLRTLLASLARTLHVGVLADCFFDPSTALCLKHVSAPEPRLPLTALCEPTKCPNACITDRHRPAWARAAADATALLREKRLSELQRVALRQDLTRVEAVLNGIGPPATAR